jgi:rhodanese-related sulfurtransferase
VRRTIDDLLAEARATYERVTPEEAARRVAEEGAVIVDTRSSDQQVEQGGIVPGALHYPLSVVLWWLDPDFPSEQPKLPLETEVILICRHGYSSSLAVAQLRELGFSRATDVAGGFDAWRAAGLPVSDAG